MSEPAPLVAGRYERGPVFAGSAGAGVAGGRREANEPTGRSWLARDTVLQRRVLLKELAADEQECATITEAAYREDGAHRPDGANLEGGAHGQPQDHDDDTIWTTSSPQPRRGCTPTPGIRYSPYGSATPAGVADPGPE